VRILCCVVLCYDELCDICEYTYTKTLTCAFTQGRILFSNPTHNSLVISSSESFSTIRIRTRTHAHAHARTHTHTHMATSSARTCCCTTHRKGVSPPHFIPYNCSIHFAHTSTCGPITSGALSKCRLYVHSTCMNDEYMHAAAAAATHNPQHAACTQKFVSSKKTFVHAQHVHVCA
jgi:hypothetical protein